MSERLRTLIALLVIGSSLSVAVFVLSIDSSGNTDRVHSLAERLKCPVCTSESVADSPSQVSRDLYNLIEEQVGDGWTDDDVVEFFVATYGEEVLLDPKTGGTGVVLWVTPIVVLTIGGLVIAGRRARGHRQISDAERKRIAAAIEERS